MIEVYNQPGVSGNCLVTIAIGNKYKSDWEKHALPGWLRYCEKHCLGLFAITEHLVSKEHPNWKKATWQKLLLAKGLRSLELGIKNACYLDTDILINPAAPNIFDVYDGVSYGLVSQIKNLPMPLDLVMRQYVFLRHNYYSKSYPLDSVVFMPLGEQYEYSGLAPFDDSACAGLILFNVENSADEMEEWFYKYDNNTPSVTDGDQTHINWEIINSGKVQWLPYEYQALWVYEMAWKYSFLYTKHQDNQTLIRDCIEATLFSNYFLHFAGSWHESDMWLVGGVLSDTEGLKCNAKLQEFRLKELSGKPVGKISPPQPSQ